MDSYRFFFLTSGLVGVSAYHMGAIFPFALSILVFIFTAFFLYAQFRKHNVGILVVVLFAYYILPFIHIIPYLWFDFGSNPQKLWGLAIRSYMLEKETMELAAMIGSIGSLGFAFASTLGNRSPLLAMGASSHYTQKNVSRTMDLPIWYFWVAFGVLMSWLAAPQETILTTAYTQSASILDDKGLDSAWAISYIVLSFAFIDAFFESNPRVRALKHKTIMLTIGFVFIYLQFLRGDRAAVPWIFSLLIFYYYWGIPYTRKAKQAIPWKVFIILAMGLILISYFLGFSRSGLMQQGFAAATSAFFDSFASGQNSVDSLLHGTWSAVLLTPMSVAGDDIRNILRLKWGEDYLNILLSLPPGFVANYFGYTRPLSANAGPAWEMTFGLGGTHAVVVPFLNFRMFGVFVIVTAFVSAFNAMEKWAVKRFSVIRLSLLCSIALTGAHFNWYGEKYMINALMIWFIFSFFYRISLGLSQIKAVK